MPSKICVCLTATSPEAQLDTAQREAAYADLYEIRLDFLSPDTWKTHISRMLGLGKALILTLRRESDGGVWPDQREAERISLLNDLVRTWASDPQVYLDLDCGIGLEDQKGRDQEGLDALAQAFRNAGPDAPARLVRSLHRFEPGIPDRLAQIYRELRELAGSGIAKLALFPAGSRDLVMLFRFAAEQALNRAELQGRHLVLGMGEYGLPTRILAARLGNPWTYASPSGQALAAPGQVDPARLAELYSFRQLERDWKIFGIYGDPISHSKSPEFHNARFQEEGLKAVYLPFRIQDFQDGLELAELLGIRGLSVTVPHKEAALACAAEASAEAASTGAANTLIPLPSGGWRALNSDIPGFLLPLEEELAPKKMRTALVIGAGGAARAVVYALASRGLEIVVVNRNQERAAQLASWVRQALGLPKDRIRIFPLDLGLPGLKEAVASAQLLVQSTSLGMDGKTHPLPGLKLEPGQIAYDLIYNPARTPFLEAAEADGARIINGMAMFLGQAEVQAASFLAEARTIAPH